MSTPEVKLLFAGPAGVGKTTAITAISERPPVSTDVAATDDLQAIKATTTVALDYAAVVLDDGTRLGLYGTPGQERFAFMWDILARGAFGLVLLVDGSSSDAVAEMTEYCRGFAEVIRRAGVVIGVNKVPDDIDLTPFDRALESLQIVAPIIAVDLRRKDDVQLLVRTLLTSLEFA